MRGFSGPALLVAHLLAQCLGEAAGDVYAMRDVRTCHGFEKSAAKCDDMPPCTEPCAPKHCEFAEWGEWYAGEGCSGLCYRHRRIQTTNNECGMPCSGSQIDSKSCPKEQCLLESQDCVLSVWSDWSACDSAVDQRYRARNVLGMPKGNGAPCSASSLNETVPCGDRLPVNCELSEWGQWTECSAKCNGYRAALRTVKTSADHGGRPCEGPLRKTESCDMESCAVGTKDCQLGEWKEWEGCDFVSPQQRYRTREVAQPAQGGGKACSESMKETMGCELDAPEDCTFSTWSAWSQCTKSCGGGQTYRKRTLAAEPKHGGKCPSLTNLTETASCNAHPCDVAKACALTSWGEWSSCSASCDTGVRERSRELLYGQAAHRRLSLFSYFADRVVSVQAAEVDCSGGYSGGLKEVAPCAAQSCERQNCLWGAWNSWSACTRTCGGGTRERSRNVETPPGIGGAPCEAQDKSEIGVCSPEPCDTCIDGKWAEWSSWSNCSATCGSGYRSRRRDIAQHPNDCGKPVTGVEDDYSPCTSWSKECAPHEDCKLTEWTPWTACSCDCFGVTERHRQVETFGSAGGKQCAGQPLKEVETCNPGLREAPPANCKGAAPAACQLSVWGDWGSCSSSCGSGQRTRLRHVLSPAAKNGEPCNGTLSEVRPCALQACPLADCLDCRYGDWGAWGACTKCGGERYRHRVITQLPNACGQPCVAADVKQLGQCTSECDEERWCAWTEWTSYSTCSAQCGPATRSRSRVMTIHKERPVEPLFAGSPGMTCEGSQLDTAACEFKSCTEECKPVHCEIGEWTEWSAPSCSQLCERTRNIRNESSCGGQACDGHLVETKSCPMVCVKPQDCVLAEWDPWSECMSEHSQKFRQRNILQDATHGGEPCEGRLTETDACFTPGLPVPCQLSNWNEWSSCTQPCLGGLKQRTRAVQVTASNGGAPCQGGLEELAACNTGRCESDVTDCVLGAWGLWSPCSRDGQQRRKRTVTPPTGGGKVCKASLEEIKECGQDCELSEWTEWDKCDKDCEAGGGQQTRHRQVTKNPIMGGLACEPHLIETRGCKQDCSVDCEVAEWADWAVCTTSCGWGERRRERKITRQPRNRGRGCENELSQLEPCRNAACDFKDCRWSEWAAWSDCSEPCGGGHRTRARHVEQIPLPGGKPCVPLAKEEVGVCNILPCGWKACVDGAWGEWEEWSECSKKCKGGTMWRSRPVKQEANHCGKPVSGPMRESKFCNTEISCEPKVDCVFGDWGAWSGCTSKCGGVKRRSREIAVEGRGNGTWCVGSTKETSPCSLDAGEACNGPPPMDCQIAPWAEWGECSATCGGGSRHRERQLLKPPSNGGLACDDVLAEVEACSRTPCHADCELQDCAWSDWGDWSACDKCGGQRKRFRHITKEPSCGGTPCKAFSSEETANCTRQCHEPVYCMWGEWKDWSACSVTCGDGGEKVRTRHLELTTAKSLPILKDFDISSAGVDEDFLQDSVGSLKTQTHSIRVRRLQHLAIAFACGGLSLVVAFVVSRVAAGLGERRSKRAQAAFRRLPLDGQE